MLAPYFYYLNRKTSKNFYLLYFFLNFTNWKLKRLNYNLNRQ